MIAENGESEGGRRIESSGLEEPARRRWYGSSFRRSGTHAVVRLMSSEICTHIRYVTMYEGGRVGGVRK